MDPIPTTRTHQATTQALLCENDADFKAVWKDALNRKEEQAARCGRIVRSVLQFSRNDDTERWPKNLVDVCRRACDFVEDYARDHHVVIQFTSPVNPVIVHLSPIQLEQALVNLLRNAVEAIGDQGGGVDVQLEADDKFARIEIRDNGCGIAPDHLARIFDPFFTTRLAADGTGLGLSMAYGIITDHGGHIEVESALGSGTRFSIRLPVASQPPNTDAA